MSNPNAPQFPTPPPQARPPRPKRWPWVLGVVGALVLGLIIGIAGSSGGGSTPTTSAARGTGAPTTVTVTATAPAPPPVTIEAAAPTTSAAVPSGPQTQFGDGTYKVGEDIMAGTYKTAGPGSDSLVNNCYWERDKNDTGSFDAIIANDNIAGPTRITLKKGEFFKASGGCTWAKS